MLKIIESEADVRKWVRECSGGKARWIEPNLGSSFGLPDCWVPWPLETGGDEVHLELKCAKLEGSILTYGVRPEQRSEIRSMVDDRVRVGLLIGVKGTPIVIFALPSTPWLRGKVDLRKAEGKSYMVDGAITTESCFQAGVNFIFSEALMGPQAWCVSFQAHKAGVSWVG